MPGPSRKSKSKKKSSLGPASRTVDLVGVQRLPDCIEKARTWEGAVEAVCGYFKLPDLASRSGLKKAYTNFETIYGNLDAAYTTFPTDERIVGAVVSIYAKMCVDSLLRDKLFNKGVLDKVVVLFGMDSCRHIALQCLTTITRHGGASARHYVAALTPTLIKLMKEHPSNEDVAEYSIYTISHSIIVVTDIEEPPDPRIIKSFQLTDAFSTICDALKKPWVSHAMISHAESLISLTAYHCSKEIAACPSAVTLMVALLRSEDIAIRCDVLLAFWRLMAKQTQQDRGGQRALVAMGAPPEVNALLMEYGPQRTDAYTTLQATVLVQKAISQAGVDGNTYKLGVSLAEAILLCEYAISAGLGLKRPVDFLPECAKAIREKGAPAEQYLADILECKFLVVNARLEEAFTVAARASQRNPDVGYFYYVLSLVPTSEDGLRSSKRGMKCKVHMTPFVKQALKHRAIEYAVDLACGHFAKSFPGDADWKKGIGFLRSAYEDAQAYVREAPPDQRQMKGAINWLIVLTLVVRGPEIDVDMTQIQHLIRRMEVVENCSNHYQMPIIYTQSRAIRQLVLKHYTAAAKEWGAVVTAYDLEPPVPNTVNTPQAVDDLARWLDKIDIEEDHGHCDGHRHGGLSANAEGIQMYRCANCGNASSVLRKCSQCETVRYCDAECQKVHWPQHKGKCQEKERAAK